MFIDPFWTAEGKAAAVRHGIDLAAVIAVVEAASSIQIQIGDSAHRLICVGGRPTIVVTLDRTYREVTRYGITDVRPATTIEARAWEKRQL